MTDHRDQYLRYQTLINDSLDDCFVQTCEQGELLEAMRYSLLAGGKRIRPILLLAFCAAAGGTVSDAVPAACGLEMLHTYSLIHDDLPCMDDDDLRRGKPTCHKVYGETNAVIAGDALQAAAFGYVLSAPLPPDRLCSMARSLSEAAGEQGMCGGQYLDTCSGAPGVDRQDLMLIHRLKTGALLRASCVMGVQAAGGSPEQIRAAGDYALHLGIAFQIRDDVLDCCSTEDVLGKPIGSDAAEGKTTFASLLGIEACDRLVREHTDKAVASLREAFEDTGFLLWLAEQLATREK